MGVRGFWLDEATTVRQALWSIPELLDRLSRGVHPPLFHLMMHFWVLGFGTSETAMRSLPMIFGIASIPLAYYAGRSLYAPRQGILAAAVVAVSPFFVWYSQEARMYAMLFTFALLTTAFMWLAMRGNRARHWLGYGVVALMGAMTQYFFLFLIGAQAVYYLVWEVGPGLTELSHGGIRDRAARLLRAVPSLPGWVLSGLVVAVPGLVWAARVLGSHSVSESLTQPLNYGWSAPTLGLHFNELILVPVEVAFGFHSSPVMDDLVSMWPVLLTLGFVGVVYVRPVSARTRFLLVTGLGSAAAMSLIGQWQPILSSRYFIAAAAPLVVLAAGYLASLRRRSFLIAAALITAISLAGWVDQSYNPANSMRWDNREAMRQVAEGFRPGDKIVLVPFFASSIAEYYLPPEAYARVRGFPRFGKSGEFRSDEVSLGQDLDQEVGLAHRVWVISTWQHEAQLVTDRARIFQWLEGQGYVVREDSQMHQIGVTLFEGGWERRFYIGPEQTGVAR